MAVTGKNSSIAESARRAFKKKFGGVLALVTENGATVIVDGEQEPPVVSDGGGRDPDCTLHGGEETLQRVLAGERGLENAFVSGRLSISGDMSVMSRIEIEGRSRHDS